jgi:hypothetical protein
MGWKTMFPVSIGDWRAGKTARRDRVFPASLGLSPQSAAA